MIDFNPRANRDMLLRYITAIMDDFRDVATWRAPVMFMAEDGNTVEVKLSPMEEFVVGAMLYGVDMALRIMPDGSEGNPFAR